MLQNRLDCEVLVVGSGPGGANTAYLLAQAGKDVILAEEGENLTVEQTPAYSLEEMKSKYRHGGMTVALGKPSVAYLEGCCVGGGSEINAGLYHYPSPEVLEEWVKDFAIRDFGFGKLEPFFKSCEQDISVSSMPGQVGSASLKLQEGARKLNWKTAQIPRCWKYECLSDGTWHSSRQSMTETIIPKALRHGCRLLTRAKVKRLCLKNHRADHALVSSVTKAGEQSLTTINFRQVFVCGGAVQTPALLRRSGIKKNIGNSLRMHPAIRMVAKFSEAVNEEQEGVPVVQVEEFKPRLTLGGSYSALPHLALWLGPQRIQKLLPVWKNLAMFYALIVGQGAGTVRNIPWTDEPWVRMPLTRTDASSFREGLELLGRLLFAAGATEIFPPMQGLEILKTPDDLKIFLGNLSLNKMDISTIHLFSSCPMGEKTELCAVDSYGKLHGFKNIYLNDASILPSAPRVNPQALIMAIARRNTAKFLENI